MSGVDLTRQSSRLSRSLLPLSLAAPAFLLLFIIGYATARAQEGVVCDLLAPTFEVLSSGASELDLAQGATDICMAQYDSPTHWALLAKLQNADVAHRAYEGHKSSIESNAYFGEIGDEHFIFTMEDASLDRKKRFHLVFRRDCYLYSADVGRPENGAFQSGVGPVEFQDMLKKAKATDAILQERGNCPASDASPSETGLGVQLNCQFNYADPGLVTCAAQAVNPQPDAVLAYEWTLDGEPQNQNDNELLLTGVAPGEHTVAVVARDTANDLASPAEQATFTKTAGQEGGAGGGSTGGETAPGAGSPAGGSTGGDGSGAGPTELGPTEPWTEEIPEGYTSSLGGPSLLAPLLVGAGAAAGAAVIIRRRRRKTPPRVQPEGLPPPNAQAGSPWPPTKGLRGMPSAPPANNPETPGARHPAPAKPPGLPERAVVGAAAVEAARKKRPPVLPERPPEQKKQEAPDLWVVAKYGGGGAGWTDRIRLRGDSREYTTVSLQAFALEDGQTRDVTWDVDFSIDPGSKKIVFRQVAGPANWEMRARHVGTMPLQGQVRFGATRRSDGKVARSCTVMVEIRQLKAEVRVVVSKQGFLHQEAVQTLDRSYEAVTGRVYAVDPLPGIGNFASLSSGFATPTNYVERGAGNPGQPVHHARCRASLRLEGGEWSKAAEVETDADGRFRVELPVGFTGIFAPEADAIPLLQELVLSVTEEVRNELDGYRREFRDAPDAAGYAPVRGKLEGYPREFFLQLCDRPEADFEPLRSALNLLRLSMGLVRSRRRDFGQQRVQIKLVAREVFTTALDWVLDLRWLAGTVLPNIVVALRDFVQRTEGAGGVRAWFARRLLLPFVNSVFAFGEFVVKGASAALKHVVSFCPRVTPEGSVFLARVSREFAKDVEENTWGTRAMRENEAGVTVPGVDKVQLRFAQALAWVNASVKVVLYLLLYIPAWLLWGICGTLLSRLFQGEVNRASNDWVRWQIKNVYDAVEAWLDWARSFLDLALGPAPNALAPAKRDAGQLLIDQAFREDEFDLEQAEALEQAYSASCDLRVPRDWLASWRRVRDGRLADLEKWRQISQAIEWGEWGFDWLKFFLTKIMPVLCALVVVFASSLAEFLFEKSTAAWKAGNKPEALVGYRAAYTEKAKASKVQGVFNVLDFYFFIFEILIERGFVLGLRLWEMWTSVYDVPDCIRALYSSNGRAAWN